ncbi:MAG TPA: hypothetical protein VNA69_11695 [Thermoanaerobaculia bacterium]|nr:hypothetical protein [Thermoanaerobaculia bacterium]
MSTDPRVHEFCRVVLARSEENRAAAKLLQSARLSGNLISILRQELDSLVRVIYLLNTGDPSLRKTLIDATLQGKPWRHPSNKKITDREMLETVTPGGGWERSVYKFGCAFIHLSELHGYRSNDPFTQLPRHEQDAILQHLRFYHGGPAGSAVTFEQIEPFLPRVLEKISENLKAHVRDLDEQS